MNVLGIKADGVRVLKGLEEGNMTVADAYNVMKDFDPVLIYFIMRYLREKYPATNPQSKGVTERLIELTGTYQEIIKASKAGEKDILREWFDDAYSVNDFRGDQEGYIDMIVEKIEG